MSKTTYTDSALSDKLKEFLQTFKKDGKYIYVDKIDSMMPKNRAWLKVDYLDFVGTELETMFGSDPERLIKQFSRAIKEVLNQRFHDFANSVQKKISVRIMNYPLCISTREINEDCIGKFISVYGFIIKTSRPVYIPTKIIYTCEAGHEITVDSDFGIPDVPVRCSNIEGGKRCTKRFEIENPIDLIPLQNVSVQDLPSVLPPGEIPGQSTIAVTGSLIEECRPGDKVIISGVLKKQRIITKKKRLQIQFRLQLNANNVKKISSENTEISEKTKQEIESIIKMPEKRRYEMLVNSIAPHVQGYDLIKESLLLLLAAHAPKEQTDYSRIKWDGMDDDENYVVKRRWDINIFLVGDPGTAKSELLKFVARVAPRGIYTSGQGSTAVGLTAALIKDPVTNEYQIAAGAMVLADLGVVSIDEFDKMKEEDRSACHETMENQTATIAKGGVYAQLNARTSVLAAANPKQGKYDPYGTVYENTRLPIPLLTRFDLIWKVRDIPDKEKDALVAQRIIAADTNIGEMTRNTFSPKQLTQYLTYIKQIHPTTTKEAQKMMEEYYVKIRSKNDEDFTITPRQFEATLRIATARATVLNKKVVDEEDVERAIFIMSKMFDDTVVDPATGKRDMSVMDTGHSKSDNAKFDLAKDIMIALQGEFNNPIDEQEIIDEFAKSGRFGDNARNFFEKLKSENLIYNPSSGKWRWIL